MAQARVKVEIRGRPGPGVLRRLRRPDAALLRAVLQEARLLGSGRNMVSAAPPSPGPPACPAQHDACEVRSSLYRLRHACVPRVISCAS